MLSDIKVMKFTNGEQVICQVITYDRESKEFSFKNPMVVLNDDNGIVMIPWPTLSVSKDETLTVKSDNLLIKPLNVIEEIKVMYEKTFCNKNESFF